MNASDLRTPYGLGMALSAASQRDKNKLTVSITVQTVDANGKASTAKLATFTVPVHDPIEPSQVQEVLRRLGKTPFPVKVAPMTGKLAENGVALSVAFRPVMLGTDLADVIDALLGVDTSSDSAHVANGATVAK